MDYDNEVDNSGNSHVPTTEEEYEKQMDHDVFDNMVKLQTARLLTVNPDRRTAKIRMNGMPHDDVTWALPFYNTEKGIGMDYIPSTAGEEGTQVLVACDPSDEKYIIGFLPKVSRDNNSSNEDYSEGRDKELASNDVSIKVNDTDNTGFFAKAQGVLEMIANPYLKIIVNAAKQLIQMKTDTFRLDTPQTNVSTKAKKDGAGTLKLTHRSNESQSAGGEMLNIIVGRDLQSGQLKAETTVSVNDVIQALNNEFNLEVDSAVNIESSTSEVNISATQGINLKGGPAPAMERAVLGETLKAKIEKLIDEVSSHNHTFMALQSPLSPPVPSITTGVEPSTVSKLQALKAELQTILSPNVKNN